MTRIWSSNIMFFDICYKSCTMPFTQSILTCEKDEIISANLIFLCEYGRIYNRNVLEDVIPVKINGCENPGKFCGVHQ